MARILIVDDEESLRFTFKSFLSRAGHEVFTAGDYLSALDFLGKMEPDMIFADIILPGGSTGIDLLRELRNRGILCPVVMITGQPGKSTAEEAVRHGAFDYVHKPVRKNVLLELTRSALESRGLISNDSGAEKK
jgi:DNA-binding NtrC family response regulator